MPHATALTHAPSDYIAGRFVAIESDPTGSAASTIISSNPADPTDILWSATPVLSHVDEAVAAARNAGRAWAARSETERVAFVRKWQEIVTRERERLGGLITGEMGKTLAEGLAEARIVAGKVDITLGDVSMGRVSDYEVSVGETKIGRCRFKPHGVMAVIGPFNFPAHLPNGHIVPALITGNTVVFKPSEKTPAVGQLMAELAHEAGFPPGVFNVVQGGAETARTLVDHAGIDGILFTGSWPVGRSILEANLDHPGRIIALELGGNNPAVVHNDAHLEQAVIECARASFATTGQRCTCTRRIVLHRDIAPQFITLLGKVASTLRVGPGRSEEPVFMGPLVTEAAVQAVLDFQDRLEADGARVIVPCSRMDGPGHFITPGIIQVDRFTLDNDGEVFGPLVQVSVVDDLDAAIEQANATRYGLAAAIFTADRSIAERFFRECRSGCINWNTGTAGASGKLPFGGLGFSGNHRPAGAFSTDYCAYPVAAMEEHGETAPVPTGMLWDPTWI